MRRLFEVPEQEVPEPYESLPDPFAWFQARASAAGADFKDIALEWVQRAGGEIEAERLKVDSYPVDALAKGGNGSRFLLLAHGTPYDAARAGLRRTDTVLKMGCRAMMISRRAEFPILVVTSHLPSISSRAGRMLVDLHQDIFDVVATVGDLQGFQRLRRYFSEVPALTEPLPSPWRPSGPVQPSLFDKSQDDA